jgi:phage terminase large subunit GpA-like protein
VECAGLGPRGPSWHVVLESERYSNAPRFSGGRATSKKHKVGLWMLATNAIKDRIMVRLKIPHPGPGFLHFPEWTTDDYFGQLTAGTKVPARNRRTNVTRHYWVKNQERNEALDLTVYAHAALWILQNKIDPKTFRPLRASCGGLKGTRGTGAASPGPQGHLRRNLKHKPRAVPVPLAIGHLGIPHRL